MKEFPSLGALALHLIEVAAAEYLVLHEGLDLAAQNIEEAATKEEQATKGFSSDEPLLRTGMLMETISHQTHALEAVIGSTDDRMVYHEFGTAKIPPRPVLGPAAFHNEIQKILGAAAVSALIGVDPVYPGLGYDFET